MQRKKTIKKQERDEIQEIGETIFTRIVKLFGALWQVYDASRDRHIAQAIIDEPTQLYFPWISFDKKDLTLNLNVQIGMFPKVPELPAVLAITNQHNLKAGVRLSLDDRTVTLQAGVPCPDSPDLELFVKKAAENFRKTIDSEVQRLKDYGMGPMQKKL